MDIVMMRKHRRGKILGKGLGSLKYNSKIEENNTKLRKKICVKFKERGEWRSYSVIMK